MTDEKQEKTIAEIERAAYEKGFQAGYKAAQDEAKADYEKNTLRRFWKKRAIS